MFSNWFSGDECGQYRTSPHKQRMDQVGNSLLDQKTTIEFYKTVTAFLLKHAPPDTAP